VKILYLEDNPNDALLTQRALSKATPAIGVDVVHSLRDAYKQLENPPTKYDLVLSDLNLPDGSGFNLLHHIRSKNYPYAVVVVTGQSDEDIAIAALKAGADDYIAKPFHLRELLLRVQRMLQRTKWYAEKNRPPSEITVAGYKVSLETLKAMGPRGEIQITVLEADLLAALTAEPERVLSRSELLERVWGYHSDVESRTVDNFIGRLRKYFEEEPEHPRHFISFRGKGYMYVP